MPRFNVQKVDMRKIVNLDLNFKIDRAGTCHTRTVGIIYIHEESAFNYTIIFISYMS